MTMTLASPVQAFGRQIRRDLRLAARRWGEVGNPLVFFVIVITLFPLALGAEHALLRRFAPGVLWVAALLAMLLAQESVFRADYEDGSLEQLALSPQPLWILVLAKVAAHWLLTGLPLVLLSPLAAGALYLPGSATLTLMLSLALGTMLLSLLGAIGAALTVGLHRGGVLLAILILPLTLPTLLLGTRATDMAASDLDPQGPLFLLCALLALAASLTPFGTAAALRIHLE
jgi:heme exporter protein B